MQYFPMFFDISDKQCLVVGGGDVAARKVAHAMPILRSATCRVSSTTGIISELCKARNLPVNVVDQPALCSFIVPSMIDRSPVQVAVSTGGAAPVLARLLRARLETMIPAAYGRLAELMDEFRDQVKARITDPEQRRHFWENVAQGSIAEMAG